MDLSLLSNPMDASSGHCGLIHVYLKNVDVEDRVGIDVELVRGSMKDTNLSLHTIRSIVQRLDKVTEAIEVVAIKVSSFQFSVENLSKISCRFSRTLALCGT